jgi:hypothetical protein
MKKLFVLLLLILISTPLYVEACSPAPPPSGISIEIEDCDNSIELYFFDILFEKDAVDESKYNDTVNEEFYTSSYYFNIYNDHPYLSFDNEWISYRAYNNYNAEHYYVYSNACSTTIEAYEFGPPIEEWLEEFKVIVISRDGEVLLESNPISMDLMPNEERQSDYYLVYDQEDNIL